MALIEFDDVSHAKILVIGCGGGGGNAVNTMISGNLDGVEFVVANTDLQALEANMAPHKIALGNSLTNDWMIAFAPANDPSVAVAVSVPDQPASATGASTSGPPTRDILGDALAASL